MLLYIFAFIQMVFAAETGRVNASALNVRSAPNQSVQCVVPNAAELPILERERNWYRVDLSKVKACKDSNVATGWVFGKPYFEPQSQYVTAQVINAPRGLRVRSAESLNATIKCSLKQGDVVSVIGPSVKNPNWLRINTENFPDCSGKEAFVHRSYIEENRTFNYVERNPPGPEGLDPIETEGGECENCGEQPTRSPIREIVDEISEAFQASQLSSTEKMVKNYSDSDTVEHMLNCAEQNVRPRSTGYCYRYVKTAILGARYSKNYLEGMSAKNAGPGLRREGFINLLTAKGWEGKITNPYDAPKGAILVYGGGPHGHIEIKVGAEGEGGFISDYKSESARTGPVTSGMSGRGRTLIGVYVKPDGGIKDDNKELTCPRPGARR